MFAFEVYRDVDIDYSNANEIFSPASVGVLSPF